MSCRLLIAGIGWPPETFLRRLIEGLRDEDVEVTIACAFGGRSRRAGLRWLWAPAWTGSRAWRLLRLKILLLLAVLRGRSELRQLWREMRPSRSSSSLASWNRLLPLIGRRFDAIYFPWTDGASAYLPLFVLGTPVVVGCRGAQINVAPHDPRRVDVRRSYARLFASAAVVHCVSEDILSEALAYGLDPKKARVIRPAVDPTFFVPRDRVRGSDDGTFRLVTTGSLIWRKGYEYLLAAVAILRSSGCCASLTIVGSGPERDRLLFTIRDLGLETSVELLGQLAPWAVRERLQQSDVFVLASSSEGISNAVLEAMACGLPVVITDCAGMPEAVTDGIEGFLVPVRSPSEMAAALSRLASEENLASRMGFSARQRVLRQFSIARQAAEFAALLEEIVG